MGTGRARPRMLVQQRIGDVRLVVDGERKEVGTGVRQRGAGRGQEYRRATAIRVIFNEVLRFGAYLPRSSPHAIRPGSLCRASPVASMMTGHLRLPTPHRPRGPVPASTLAVGATRRLPLHLRRSADGGAEQPPLIDAGLQGGLPQPGSISGAACHWGTALVAPLAPPN